MIEPYYRSEDGAITVFHARMEDVLAAGIFEPREVTLVHADPPYGVKEQTRRASKGRGGRVGTLKMASKNAPCMHRVYEARDFPPVAGDDRAYDPAPLVALDRPLVLWGANHYAPRVPESPSWILWDKRDGSTPDDNADGELAWSNLGGPLRIFRHLWRGLCRASEQGTGAAGGGRHLHPTQKPIALCSYVYQRAKLKRGDLVFVPYLGSGPDLPAALAMGLRVVACDVEEWCCRTAVAARLNAAPHPEPTNTLGPLYERIKIGSDAA